MGSGWLDGLPTYEDINRTRRALPKGATPSRLQVKTEKARDERKDEERWKRDVWKRDGGNCRWCGRAVRRCLELAPDRGEVHHVSGRVVAAIRWERRNGLLLCAADHERITGKVAERFLIHSKHTFTVDGIAYINADKPVRYQRVA
jgi:predicted chitinase